MSNNKQIMKLYTEEELCSILRLFIEDTRGDKPWVDADDEWLQQFLKQNTMSNNKQSSVSKLIAEIQRRVAIIQSEPQTMARELMIDNLSVDLEQYEAMHKDEIINATIYGDRFEGCYGLDSEQYYNETFGNEQR